MQAVDPLVEEIGAARKPTMFAFNKVEAVDKTTSEKQESLKGEKLE